MNAEALRNEVRDVTGIQQETYQCSKMQRHNLPLPQTFKYWVNSLLPAILAECRVKLFRISALLASVSKSV